MEDDFLQEAEDDVRTIAFIRTQLPQELKERFTDDDLFYAIDAIADYYATSGVLDQEPDAEGYIDVDIMAVAEAVAAQAKKDGMGPYSPEDLQWVVQAELEYGEEQ